MQSFSISGFKIKVPIIQGGMGVGISLNGLASAVANEGGVGEISSSGLGLYYRHLSIDYVVVPQKGIHSALCIAYGE